MLSLTQARAAKGLHCRKPRQILAVHFWRGFSGQRRAHLPNFSKGSPPKSQRRGSWGWQLIIFQDLGSFNRHWSKNFRIYSENVSRMGTKQTHKNTQHKTTSHDDSTFLQSGCRTALTSFLIVRVTLELSWPDCYVPGKIQQVMIHPSPVRMNSNMEHRISKYSGGALCRAKMVTWTFRMPQVVWFDLFLDARCFIPTMDKTCQITTWVLAAVRSFGA